MPKQNKTAVLTIRLLPEEKEWLIEYAEKMDMPVTRLVRQIIREYRELIAE